jgi:CheY-like chemotaxis protein
MPLKVKKQCIDAGMYEYLSKPFNQMQLNQILSKFINTPFQLKSLDIMGIYRE